MKLTKNRKQVLEILKKNKETMSAGDVAKALPEINRVSIYRALEYLHREALITQFFVGGEARYEFQKIPHIHAVCQSCTKIFHVNHDKLCLSQAVSKVENFSIQDVQAVVTGNCSSC